MSLVRHLVLSFAIAAAPLTIAAQRAALVGTVLGEPSEKPLVGAEVTIPKIGRSVRTDSAGHFRLDALPEGSHVIVVRLIGYAPIETTLSFGAAETLDREFVLALRPARLAEVEVKKEAIVRGRLADFEERRKMGMGYFITEEILEAQRDHRTGDVLLTKVPGIKLIAIGGNSAALGSTRGRVSLNLMPRGDESDRRHGAPREGACYPQVWVDGTNRYAGGKDEKLFDINSVSPSEIAAVEFYSSSQVPPRYNLMNSVCGTLVIWTRG
ncbi:MAG: carboxypeptidase-like regulatory domain-containing protein [Gemmatimonadota bacterium]|nr:carboxypeptidase-like regulatory domain-containing protein [Gemmatimonadota bacterium]